MDQREPGGLPGPPETGLRAPGQLGPLEWRALQTLWDREGRTSVRDLMSSFRDIAYTTLMTTLDRLYRKGLLERSKAGRAFLYWPRMSRAQFHSAQAAQVVRSALAGGRAEPELLLSSLVDAVTEQDQALLDELESLVRARRKSIAGGAK